MSQDTATEAGAAHDGAEEGEQKHEEAQEAQEAQEQRRNAWAARQDLLAHGPEFVSTLAHRDQYGITGGVVHGDVNFFGVAGGRREHRSGEIRRADVERLAEVFRSCPSFDEALARLRTDKVVFLAGGRETGRRSAALMLLHRLGVDRMRSLDSHTSLSELPDQVKDSAGYVLRDLNISRGRPLREPQLLALHEQLENTGGSLVVTVEPSAALGDVPFVRWEPPSAEDLLQSHVTRLTGAAAWAELCGLAPVKEFLMLQRQPREIEGFAHQLAALHRGETGEEQLAAYGEAAVVGQISRWLTGEKPDLRDKAFLISLAVFDKAPYAVTAELSDGLFTRLQKTEDPTEPPRIDVFGRSRDARLQLARAQGHMGTEVTEWGAVTQFVAGFREERTARIMLREVWNMHPSARPALVDWVRRLSEDGRPLVRTRAAAAAAMLAEADLPSALAHLIEPWADSRSSGAWLTAANALTMAVLLKVPTVPRILHSWCTGDYESRRWTAIRAYGLLGPVHHEEALQALLDAAHRRPDDEDEAEEAARQLADALQLLLLAVEGPVLKALAERIGRDGVIRDHALPAFLQACEQTDDDSDRPRILSWYARAAAADDTEDNRHLTAFWHTALSDRDRTSAALKVLRSWVLQADQDPEAEAALALLLPTLTTTAAHHQRISHLLRTVRDSDNGVPQAAVRLQMSICSP